MFGRDASFDPQSDPIVRVEAGQLRRAVDRYNLGAGRMDTVAISIPKGGDVPQFDWREPAETPAPPLPAVQPLPPGRAAALSKRHAAAALIGVALFAIVLAVVYREKEAVSSQPDLPRLLVQPFKDLSQSDQAASIACGLTQEVIGQISKFKDIVVIAADADGNPLSGEATLPAAAVARYLLQGAVDIDPPGCKAASPRRLKDRRGRALGKYLHGRSVGDPDHRHRK